MLLTETASRAIQSGPDTAVAAIGDHLRILICGLNHPATLSGLVEGFEMLPEIEMFGIRSLCDSTIAQPKGTEIMLQAIPEKLSIKRIPHMVLLGAQLEQGEVWIRSLREAGVNAPVIPIYTEASGAYSKALHDAGFEFPLLETGIAHRITGLSTGLVTRALEVIWLMRIMTWLNGNRHEFSRLCRLYGNIAPGPNIALKLMATRWSRNEMYHIGSGSQ